MLNYTLFRSLPASLTKLITCVLGNQDHETVEVDGRRLLVIYGSAANTSFAIVPGWYDGNEKFENGRLMAVDVEMVDPIEQERIEEEIQPRLQSNNGKRVSFWGAHNPSDANEMSDVPGGHERELSRTASNEEPTVLVVDDDPTIREIIKLSLQREGFKVESASNVEEAKDLLTSRRDKLPGLMLLDIMMPGGSGWQLLKDLEKHQDISEMPVIAISGLEKPQGAGEEYDSRMLYDYLVKPFSMAELSRAVKKFARK